ncbi:MAG: hypothetical protein ACXWF5_07210 [Actinomycetota bacterium]
MAPPDLAELAERERPAWFGRHGRDEPELEIRELEILATPPSEVNHEAASR